MNLSAISTEVALIFSIAIVLGCIGTTFKASSELIAVTTDSYREVDESTDDQELSIDEFLTDYLIYNDYVSDDVDKDDVFQIVQQAFAAADEFEDVTPGMILAVISNESSFHWYSTSNANARGLMQLTPRWHKERLKKYLSENDVYDDDLFYNNYLNIMTGADYLQQIIGQMKNEYHDDDLRKVFMWYNQGAVPASTDWNKGVYSGWSKQVKKDMEDIDKFIAVMTN